MKIGNSKFCNSIEKKKPHRKLEKCNNILTIHFAKIPLEFGICNSQLRLLHSLCFFHFFRMISRALLSVSDKTGIVDFAKFLASKNIELLSTGGTAKILRENNIPVKDVSEFTGFPEMLDGRVKTLHPKIHGGLLHVRNNPEHVKTVEEHGIGAIDLVVVNLYPFAEVLKKGGNEEELIENIDIGGPSMLRSAAKNFQSVTVITDPADYAVVQAEMENQGNTSLETRKRLMGKVYATTAQYDALIASRFAENFSAIFPRKIADLRYGENPHQNASVFSVPMSEGVANLAKATPLQGKELSYNNLLDADAAIRGVLEFSENPACVIVKHLSPCGMAMGEDALDAYSKALEADSLSAFGGVVAINREVDASLAKKMNEHFLEIIIAPSITPEALEIFTQKPALRILQIPNMTIPTHEQFRDMRTILGGFVMQDLDTSCVSTEDIQIMTKRKPSQEELENMLFAWKCVKTVKSNAIVLVKDRATVGIGGGLTSRVDASELAVKKAGTKGRGAVAASDAFFPFADGPEALGKAGITAIIQPGGSKNDQQVIDACDAMGIAMVFTGIRVFRH